MTKAGPADVQVRTEVTPGDVRSVRELAEATGFFRADEVEVAAELVEERLARGEASGYHFLFAESGRRVVGYACYGPIACTVSSYDLYWIAVHPGFQGHGLGTLLIREAEGRIAARGGTRVYVETSGKAAYASTRAFYERRGYLSEAVLEGFYAPGDDKVILVKKLG